ncbi:hypothetical protein BDM02DRAFT_2973142 [Thelephora ganbajun]|uniref:Uncharacterized protein n=1 Tax=Thelephora ganbajun TaxID=370292 RepID=A0ACB6ZTG7_THEGA|nr:hypothetical protein BDM02DRAFT_2973142 [Thelephora ganbajun]
MQTAYMPTTSAQAAWRPRINPSSISSANASMPPHPPQGYQGPWPPPPPPGYPGPPPAQLPPSVSAQQWSKGYWRFDPKPTGWSSASGAPPQPPPQQQQYYNPGVVNSNAPRPPSQQAGGPPGWSQAWMPHPGWQMPVDHNPYKRMPKEPDPSYFSVELSENPLGLENMHITRASRPQEKPFTTPWRWVPEDLPPSDDEKEDESTPPNGSRAASSRDDPSSARHHHTSSASQQVSRHLSQDSKLQPSSSSREVEQYRLKAYPSSSSRRNTQEHTPPQDSSLYRSSSMRNAQEYTPPSDSSPRRTSSRKNTQEYTPPSDDQRRPSALSQVHTPDDRSKREKEKDRRKTSDSDEHEAFSGKKELHPTFSPAIIRTPKYYLERTSTPNNVTPTKPSSTRRASDGPGVPPHGTVIQPLNNMLTENVPSVLSPLIGATPRPSSTTIPGLDRISRGELSSSSSSSSPSSKDRSSRSHSRSNSLSKADVKSHRSLQRTDTLTSRTMSPTRYDERPQPPTYYSSSSSSSLQQSSRSVGRSQTYPSLDPVSENPYPSTRRDSRDGRESRESRNPPTSISRASDAVKDLARPNGRTVGRSHTEPRPSHNPTRATSPLRALSPTRALSPPRSSTPSRSSSRAPSRSHTPTSSGVVVPPVPVPPLPADASHRYRTSSSAPRKYHFSSYDGRTIPWDRRMKEYPDSLSKHGKPPRYPFEYFLKYIEVNDSDIRSPESPSPY